MDNNTSSTAKCDTSHNEAKKGLIPPIYPLSSGGMYMSKLGNGINKLSSRLIAISAKLAPFFKPKKLLEPEERLEIYLREREWCRKNGKADPIIEALEEFGIPGEDENERSVVSRNADIDSGDNGNRWNRSIATGGNGKGNWWINTKTDGQAEHTNE